ncbi:helix-turn-helix domain-containing protein [Epilithonimonas sp. UC225_85]|uniref:helix-turn-helix domain-containing protein n=1 Tax=Epilithonimonas sp. UC225_85 TaxID=3350167 RepID=UPI0036D2A4E7
MRDIEYIKAFGINLKKLRTENKIAQEELANSSDIPISQIGRIERGEINTTISTVYALSKALKINVQELFNFNIEKKE